MSLQTSTRTMEGVIDDALVDYDGEVLSDGAGDELPLQDGALSAEWPWVPLTAGGTPDVAFAQAAADYDGFAYSEEPRTNVWTLSVPVRLGQAGSFVAAFPQEARLPEGWQQCSATVAVRNEVVMDESTDTDLQVILAMVPVSALGCFRLIQETAPAAQPDMLLFTLDDDMPHSTSLVSVATEFMAQSASAGGQAQAGRGAKKRPTVTVLSAQVEELSRRLIALEDPGPRSGFITPQGSHGARTPRPPSPVGSVAAVLPEVAAVASLAPPLRSGVTARATLGGAASGSGGQHARGQRSQPLSGYAQSKRTAAQAAEDARKQAASLLSAAGIPQVGPQPERRMQPKRRQVETGAASHLDQAPAPAGGSLLQTIASQVASGAEPDSRMLRLAELQGLSQLAGSIAPKRELGIDPLCEESSREGSQQAGLTMSRGMEGLQRVQRSREQDPSRWCNAFDAEIQRELFTTVTGRPWCLLDYVQKRMRFRPPQDADLEHVTHMMCALHACHRKGPEANAELGMLVGQFFKAIEARHRDGDWLVAWTMTGLPDPQPRPGFARGLAHPAEYAAGIAKMREMQMVSQYRATLSSTPAANPRGQINPKKEIVDPKPPGNKTKGGKDKGKGAKQAAELGNGE